jgi:hypothetical protein
MFVKPAPSPFKEGEVRRILRPGNFVPLPAEGAEVPDDDPFWNRRLAQGDVIRIEPAAPAAAAEPTQPAAAPTVAGPRT